jgi:hypothetical protein
MVERPSEDIRGLWLSLGVYLLIFALNLVAYFLTGVMALFAEALHTLSDIFISGFLLLATEAPTFVAGFLGMFTGHASAMGLGALPAVWLLTGPLYMLGALLFGIATIRAGILSRWAAGVFGFEAILSPAFALLPHELEPIAVVPVGIGLAWLGYALWSERRENAVQSLPVSGGLQLRQTGAE